MIIVGLTQAEAARVGEAISKAAALGQSVLVSIDGPPQETGPAFKIKINGGVWSPPMGFRA